MNIGSKVLSLVAVAAVVALAGGKTQAKVQITVLPSLAPNVFGSSSWDTYANNALSALESGHSSAGDSTSPSFYQYAPSTIQASQNIVTGFNSWNGQANPGSPYDNEYGNRLTYGVIIKGTNGEKFSISQLGFKLVDTDAATAGTSESLSLDVPGSPYPNFGAVGTANYSSSYLGFVTGDTTPITSGVNTQLVNEIVAIGHGNAWAAYSSSPGATLQDKINNEVATVTADGPFSLTGTYWLQNTDGSVLASGSATVNVVPVPASAWLALGVFGVLGFGMMIRRQRHTSA